ncbi:MAG TPA: hypothetical protein PLD88_03940, partial [Candidatus Berkiella sp.]|nr:hypothetical protein [Candidatus Berkiella sp.]
MAKQVAMLIKHVSPESAEFIKIKSQIDEAKKTQQSVKDQANDILASLETEMTFILREISPINDIEHDHAIARYKRKVNLAHKHLEANDSDDVEVNFDVVSVIHLKNFLKADYNPALSLKENIKQYFQDPLIRVMLYMGGEVEGRKLYDHPQIGLRPHIQDFQREGGQYDEELIEHLCEQLEQMVLAETQNAGTYALYNATAGDLSVGNDVIRELSSLFAGKGYDAMFRLFSTGFDYKTAEDFRKDVYETKKMMDEGSDFHSRGLCCGLSPFQPLQNESPLDFWAHNRNIQGGFDRWQQEILPKLDSMISDRKVIQELNREYQELVELSKQLGARMTQFLMSPEDIDQYAWLSGAYGFKLPAMTTKLDQLAETDKLSEALNFYTEAPDDFIRETENRRKIFMDAPENADKFVDHLGINHKKEVYDETYNTAIENRKNLGQLQARLYLHPDLFEPGRMQVNTYYSLPTNMKIEAEYHEKLHQFSEKICGLVIKAQRKNLAKKDR